MPAQLSQTQAQDMWSSHALPTPVYCPGEAPTPAGPHAARRPECGSPRGQAPRVLVPHAARCQSSGPHMMRLPECRSPRGKAPRVEVPTRRGTQSAGPHTASPQAPSTPPSPASKEDSLNLAEWLLLNIPECMVFTLKSCPQSKPFYLLQLLGVVVLAPCSGPFFLNPRQRNHFCPMPQSYLVLRSFMIHPI